MQKTANTVALFLAFWTQSVISTSTVCPFCPAWPETAVCPSCPICPSHPTCPSCPSHPSCPSCPSCSACTPCPSCPVHNTTLLPMQCECQQSVKATSFVGHLHTRFYCSSLGMFTKKNLGSLMTNSNCTQGLKYARFMAYFTQTHSDTPACFEFLTLNTTWCITPAWPVFTEIWAHETSNARGFDLSGLILPLFRNAQSDVVLSVRQTTLKDLPVASLCFEVQWVILCPGIA